MIDRPFCSVWLTDAEGFDPPAIIPEFKVSAVKIAKFAG
jgi:hypothetical protein